MMDFIQEADVFGYSMGGEIAQQFTVSFPEKVDRLILQEISRLKDEPEWMRQFRLRSYDIFMNKPVPNWGGNLSKIDFQHIYYYAKAVHLYRVGEDGNIIEHKT